jgi:hypothetical protein
MLKAFTVTEKMLDCLSGKVNVKYEFGFKEETAKKHTTFANLVSANAYLDASARDWFLGAIEIYINHKKHIIEAAHPEQTPALKICLQAYDHYCKMSIDTIAEKFVKGYDWFIKILPSDSNPSYKTSLGDLNELKLFCDSHLKKIGK